MNQQLYDYYILQRAHREQRIHLNMDLATHFSAHDTAPEVRMAERFKLLCEMEQPRIQSFEKIAMVRTIADIPDCFTKQEWEALRKEHHIHELGYVSNLSPNYAKIISQGLISIAENASEVQMQSIASLITLCDRYKEEAERLGRDDLVEVFTQVPRYGARNFREALQFFRILHFALWLEGNYHNTVGRFDVYMYPYFKKDMDAGIYTRETALELLEDFFVSFNKDSDLYVGVQQGDNGQSMVLGGTDAEGNDHFTLLSQLCLEASRNLKLIDPKINLRVSKKTPLEVYEKGTELTAAGLGFPQYSNDDIVIPGLIRLGYEPADAANYAMAACWEFIIPGVGDDIANIDALNMPKVVDDAIREYLPTGGDFDGLMEVVHRNILSSCDAIINKIKSIWFVPSPFMDLLRDGRKYQNFGIHGCGIACAADALAAVKQHVYDEKTVTPERLLAALESNYENDPELLHLLRYESPKMGEDNDLPDGLAEDLLNAFADAVEGKKNCLGGIWRVGTGTAMYYLWHAREVGATADGRRKGDPYGTNYSASLLADLSDPIAVVRSFTKQDIVRAMNGGPLTLEFAGSIFKQEESRKKVAQLLHYFVQRGGHQLQLNAVDPETMRKAQKDPDRYRQLVVRIWGWSAYFVELDKEYQDHVLARQEYTL